MSGLILLFALGICFWLGGMLVRWVGQMVPNPKWQGPAKTTVALALIASPFVDEVIGMYQFNALCKANGIESADVSKARGKRVIASYGERRLIEGVIIPIKASEDFFRDASNGDIVIHSKDYYAKGGWLMRYTPLSMGSPQPILFDGNGCGFVDKDRIFSSNQIVQIN